MKICFSIDHLCKHITESGRFHTLSSYNTCMDDLILGNAVVTADVADAAELYVACGNVL